MDTVSRRQFMNLSSAGALAAITCGAQSVAVGRTVSKTEWMDQLMKNPTAPKRKTADSPLRLGRFREPMYFLLEPISWLPNSDQAGKFDATEAPAGFVTDLASVPRPFWSLLRPDDDYAYAAIIHDYMYWVQARPREMADQVLKFAMADFDVASWKITAIYDAVRSQGQRAWNANARLKAQGERRVLKEFPPKGKTRWADWKKRPDAFAGF
jgi:hypothetical protein